MEGGGDGGGREGGGGESPDQRDCVGEEGDGGIMEGVLGGGHEARLLLPQCPIKKRVITVDRGDVSLSLHVSPHFLTAAMTCDGEQETLGWFLRHRTLPPRLSVAGRYFGNI